MKKLFSTLLLLVLVKTSALLACEKVNIITDIDDTIKQTNVLNKGTILIKGTSKSTPAFPLMNELYEKVLNKCGEKNRGQIFYVSASPKMTKNSVEYFLNSNNFPKGILLQKNWVFPFLADIAPNSGYDNLIGGTLEYKIKKINEVINSLPNEKFILIGDNGEKDPVIYKEITKLFPSNIIDVEIRYVANKSKIFGREFLTTANLAEHFFNNNVISDTDLYSITQKELNALTDEYYKSIPDYMKAIDTKNFFLNFNNLNKMRLRDVSARKLDELFWTYNSILEFP